MRTPWLFCVVENNNLANVIPRLSCPSVFVMVDSVFSFVCLFPCLTITATRFPFIVASIQHLLFPGSSQTTSLSSRRFLSSVSFSMANFSFIAFTFFVAGLQRLLRSLSS